MDPKIEKRFKNTSKSKTFNNIVRTYKLDKKAVLDIGCSYGEFVASFGGGSTGITITKEEAEYGQKRGLDIRFGNIEDDNFELNQQYDVIFANNLFEHLFAPHSFLIKIRKYLKPDGILILGVPCVPKIVSLVNITKFRGSLAGAHINFFTRYTLMKTAERGGWDPVAVRGFRFANPILDHLLDSIYPHFYVVAKKIPDFQYTDKRMKELEGYGMAQKVE